jgi:hypothetical protein
LGRRTEPTRDKAQRAGNPSSIDAEVFGEAGVMHDLLGIQALLINDDGDKGNPTRFAATMAAPLAAVEGVCAFSRPTSYLSV